MARQLRWFREVRNTLAPEGSLGEAIWLTTAPFGPSETLTRIRMSSYLHFSRPASNFGPWAFNGVLGAIAAAQGGPTPSGPLTNPGDDWLVYEPIIWQTEDLTQTTAGDIVIGRWNAVAEGIDAKAMRKGAPGSGSVVWLMWEWNTPLPAGITLRRLSYSSVGILTP